MCARATQGSQADPEWFHLGHYHVGSMEQYFMLSPAGLA